MGNKNLPYSWEEDGYIVTRATAWSAPGCHEGCGVLCYVKDGKLVKVEGDPEHPYNQGRLCPRCVAVPDVVNAPDRIVHPMKRDPERRGDPDAWEQITWDEALDLIETKFKKYAEEFGPECLQVFCGTGRDILWESQRLCYSMGSPHVESYDSGLACWMPRLVAYTLTTGSYMMPDCSQRHEKRFDFEEYRIPEVIICWGNNCVQSSSDGFFGDWMVECMRRGSKLIVIDPRVTWLAARAVIHIQPRPAVDSTIAISMLKTIIDEDLYDHEFVDLWCYGFDELKARMDEYDVDELCAKAWVDPEKVRAAARMYAAGNNSAIQMGLALDMQRHGVAAVMAIIDMIAICNNIDVPGGQIPTGTPYNTGNFGWGWENLTEDAQKKLVGYNEYPLIRMGMRLDQPDLTIVQAETEIPNGFKAAIMMGTNPMCCMSRTDLSRVVNVLKKLEFIVDIDYYMTPTAQYLTDVFLPVAMWCEREGIRNKYTQINPLVKIEGLDIPEDVKGDEEIAFLLGKRFNPDMWPWETTEEVLNEIIKNAHITYQELKEEHWIFDPSEYQKYLKGHARRDGQIGFNTSTGRVELFSNYAASIGCDPLPYYDEPWMGPYTTPEMYEEYPVIVMTGTRMIQYFHSEHRNIPKLREIQPDPMVEINDEWGKEHDIRDGDWVWMEEYRGRRVRQRAKLTPTLLYGTANLNSGWWYPETDPHEDPTYQCLEVGPNMLTEPGHQGPTGFGADAKAILCKIYKCEEGEY